MPGEEAPGLSSVRIQRALRLNGIEDGRLLQSIRLLDCEKQRSVRLIHQDIRLVNLTLDFIHTSSGFSIEGISPYLTIQEHKAELAPCFEYGDRITSRRFGKFRKHDRSDFRDTPNPAGNQGDGVTALRPQSSPNDRRPGYKAGKSGFRLADSGSGAERRVVGGSGTLRAGIPKSAPPGFSRVGLGTRGKPQNEDTYPQGIRNAIAVVGAKKRLQLEISDMLTGIRKDIRESARAATPRQREGERPGARPSTTKRQNVMDVKKAIQIANEEKLNVRIKEFLSRIPLSKNGAQRT